MKKVIGWTLYILALAATVCCFVFPVQAKETCENIMNVLNTPIGIAGISTTIGGIILFIVTKFILTNTKFGRRELDKNRKENNEFKKIIVEHEKALNEKVSLLETEHNTFIENANNEMNEFKDTCNNQVTVMLEEFEDLQKDTITALKAIPNKKVQAIVAEYEKQYEVRKEEIIEKTVNTNDYIDKKLDEMFNEFKNKMETMLNEREETIDSETEAE